MSKEILKLPSRLCPGADYYRMVALHPLATTIICGGERFDKRCKEAHRMTVADTRGRLEITVPIAKPYGATWGDTAVSLHGRWWEVAWFALESAYGRTPFFEFYADDFRPIFHCGEQFGTVGELNLRFDRAIRRALSLSGELIYSAEETTPDPIPAWQPEPYWQVRRESLGFIPGLSILDMLFNLGPETLLKIQN